MDPDAMDPDAMDPDAMDPDAMDPDAMDPDAMMPCATTAACLAEAEAALVAAEAALVVLEADDEATQGAVKAAEAAVEAAEMALATAKTAHTEYLASQPPTYDPEALQTAITADSHGQTPFTVDAGKVTKSEDGADDFTASLLQEAPPIKDWQDSVHERTTDGVTDTVVSYTDVEAPTDQAYDDYYGIANQPGVTGAAGNDGVLTLVMEVGANHELFDAAAFPVGSNTFELYMDDAATTDVNERMFKGSFNGIPGTFACGGNADCRAENDADGDLAMLTGDWTFAPDAAPAGSSHMIAGVVPDPDYLDFGYWVKTTMGEGGPTYDVNTFADGLVDYDSISNVEGEASYTGGAAGLFSRKEFTQGGQVSVVAGGRFTADAELTAYFGGDDVTANQEDTIGGTISRFMHNGRPIDPAWRVTLEADLSLAGDGTFTGMANVDGDFSGTFHGPSTDAMPTGVSGQFDTTFDNGNVIGAFGATLVPVPAAQ